MDLDIGFSLNHLGHMLRRLYLKRDMGLNREIFRYL